MSMEITTESTETLEEALRAALIIEQQTEILNESISALASEFGVSKGIAKKIIMAFAKDKLEKTQEKLEDERTALSNADTFIQVVENMSLEGFSRDEEDGEGED